MRTALLSIFAAAAFLPGAAFAQANDASATEDNNQPRQLTNPRTSSEPGEPVPVPQTLQDALVYLHETNLKETAAGRLALERGQSKEVRDYGQMLIDEHTAADAKVAERAAKHKVDLEKAIAPAPNPKVAEADATQFDQVFAEEMVRGHEMVLAVVRRMKSNEELAPIHPLLEELTPHLMHHREAAQTLVDGTTGERTDGSDSGDVVNGTGTAGEGGRGNASAINPNNAGAASVAGETGADAARGTGGNNSQAGSSSGSVSGLGGGAGSVGSGGGGGAN